MFGGRDPGKIYCLTTLVIAWLHLVATVGQRAVSVFYRQITVSCKAVVRAHSSGRESKHMAVLR